MGVRGCGTDQTHKHTRPIVSSLTLGTLFILSPPTDNIPAEREEELSKELTGSQWVCPSYPESVVALNQH